MRREASRPEGSESGAGRRFARILCINLGVLAALLACLEVGARVLAPRELRALFDDPQVFVRGRDFVVPDPVRGFALRPGFASGGIHIDKAGFRGPELPADLRSRRLVLAVGESSTFGWMVQDEETYPVHLQRILAAADTLRPVCVVNAGVPSYTSAQVRLYLQQLLRDYEPEAVVAGVLWNDVLFSCLDNWLPDYLVHQQPQPWRQFLLRHSGLYRALIIRDEDPARAREVDNPAALAAYEHNLEEMIRECDRHRVRLLFLRPSVDPGHVPERGMKIWRRTIPKDTFLHLLHTYVEAMQRVAAAHGVQVVTHRLAQEDPQRAALFIDPVHLDGAGNRLLAEDVAAALAGPGPARR